MEADERRRAAPEHAAGLLPRRPVVSYLYSTLLETRLLDAGCLQLCLYGMEQTLVTITGRHLGDLAALIGMGRVKSVSEDGPRNYELPEEGPAICRITVEELTGPSGMS